MTQVVLLYLWIPTQSISSFCRMHLKKVYIMELIELSTKNRPVGYIYYTFPLLFSPCVWRTKSDRSLVDIRQYKTFRRPN